MSHVTINRLARDRVPGCEELFLGIILKALAIVISLLNVEKCNAVLILTFLHESIPSHFHANLLGSSLYVMFQNDVSYSRSSIVLGTLNF